MWEIVASFIKYTVLPGVGSAYHGRGGGGGAGDREGVSEALEFEKEIKITAYMRE